MQNVSDMSINVLNERYHATSNSIIHSLIWCTNINIISWILVENIWSVNTGYSQPKTIRLWLVYISETSNTENKV